MWVAMKLRMVGGRSSKGVLLWGVMLLIGCLLLLLLQLLQVVVMVMLLLLLLLLLVLVLEIHKLSCSSAFKLPSIHGTIIRRRLQR
jgi:hypothetical protein